MMFFGWIEDPLFFWTSEDYLKVINFNKKNLKDKYFTAYFIDNLFLFLSLILEGEVEKSILCLVNAFKKPGSLEKDFNFDWVVDNKEDLIKHLKSLQGDQKLFNFYK